MLRKTIVLFFSFFCILLSPSIANGNEYYDITNFKSDIVIEKDTSLLVKETINVNFKEKRHGIYRIIPVVYSSRGRTINSRLKVLSITDENGTKYNYEKERLSQSISLKIGDGDIEIYGPKTYVVTYKVYDVLQKYGKKFEIYWNLTGHEWDTEIVASQASLSSPHANIIKADCFAGYFGTTEKNCSYEVRGNAVNAESSGVLNPGDDFTLLAELSPENSLTPPSGLTKILQTILNNWGYILSPIPMYLIFYFWYKRGRDERYTGSNIYYKEDKATTETKPVFAREHLPLVYHPINGLTPSEIGVIVDEKVDIEDVLSEIVEIARLGYFEVRKIVKKKIFKDQVEYAFIKSEKFNNIKARANLRDYQEYLLTEIFDPKNIEKSKELSGSLLRGEGKEMLAAVRELKDKEYVLVGSLKNVFYESLNGFKDKLYKRMQTEGLFFEDPEKVRTKWIGLYFVMCFLSGWLAFVFAANTYNFGPVIALALLSIPGFFLSLKMPRRTPKGYSFKRQIEGLSWYLDKGKWRYEVSEKNLFIEEVLPLAIALGVVDKLTRDMADLGVKPPTYMSGVSTNSFASDFSGFRTASTNSFFSTPQGKWSGSSSWSGGSGFSGGGSSGGGFGGGGGGSW